MTTSPMMKERALQRRRISQSMLVNIVASTIQLPWSCVDQQRNGFVTVGETHREGVSNILIHTELFIPVVTIGNQITNIDTQLYIQPHYQPSGEVKVQGGLSS